MEQRDIGQEGDDEHFAGGQVGQVLEDAVGVGVVVVVVLIVDSGW